MCTSFLHPTGAFEDYEPSKDLKIQLNTLDKAAYAMLSACLATSMVFIITNAAEGWVEYSANKYLPKVSELIPQIKVLSA